MGSFSHLTRAWNTYRIVAFSAISILPIAWGLVSGWSGGLVLGVPAFASLADAVWRHRRDVTHRVGLSVNLDVVVLGMGLLLVELGPTGVMAPLAYMLVVPLLLLSLRSAVLPMTVAVFMAVVALTFEAPVAPPEGVGTEVVSWFTFLLFTALLLTLVAVTARALHQAGQDAERSRNAEAALAETGQRLLAEVDQVAMNDALETLRISSGASATFVAENKGDLGAGPVAVVSQIAAAADVITESTAIRWKLPYLQHQEFASALARGESVRLDGVISAATGTVPDSTFALAVPMSVGGEWAGFLGVAYDLDETPDPDPDMRVMKTVAAMVGSFLEKRYAYEQVQDALDSRDQFLASVTHELKNPLTSVLGFTSFLKEELQELSAEEATEMINLVDQQAREVADLVEDLLVAARAGSGGIPVSYEVVDLAELVSAVVDGRLDTDDREFEVGVGADHQVAGDPTRVRQILRNLVTNAVRYGGDRVTISSHREGGEVVLVFSDNGEGVPPELARRIFDPYQRGSAPARTESVGLGLTVSRQLARLMSGDLALRTDLGPATFQLTLPAAVAASAQPAEELEAVDA